MYLKDLQVNNANSNNFPWASPPRKQSHLNERQISVRVPTEKHEVFVLVQRVLWQIAKKKEEREKQMAGNKAWLISTLAR